MHPEGDHLSGGFNPLANASIDHEPRQQEAPGAVPLEAAHVRESAREAEHFQSGNMGYYRTVPLGWV